MQTIDLSKHKCITFEIEHTGTVKALINAILVQLDAWEAQSRQSENFKLDYHGDGSDIVADLEVFGERMQIRGNLLSCCPTLAIVCLVPGKFMMFSGMVRPKLNSAIEQIIEKAGGTLSAIRQK